MASLMHVMVSLSEIEAFSLVNSQNSLDYERSARLALSRTDSISENAHYIRQLFLFNDIHYL
jgi:hypothetical protein